MSEYEKKIFEKLEDLDTRLDNMNVNLAEYNIQLKEHMRRTELLEEELKPVTRHVNMMHGAGKLLGITSIGLGVILTILRLTGTI